MSSPKIFNFTSALIISILLLFVTSPVFAADEPLPSDSSSLKLKIKALQEEIASKASVLKSQISQKLENKAYFGTVTQASSDRLVLKSQLVDLNINLRPFTSYKKVSSKLLAGNDLVVALGDLDEQGNLIAKQVIKVDPPQTVPKFIFGKITGKDKNLLNLKDNTNHILSATFNNATVFQKADIKVGSKDLELNQTAIIALSGDGKEAIIKFIYLLK